MKQEQEISSLKSLINNYGTNESKILSFDNSKIEEQVSSDQRNISKLCEEIMDRDMTPYKYEQDISNLNKTVINLKFDVQEKDKIISNLETKLSSIMEFKSDNSTNKLIDSPSTQKKSSRKDLNINLNHLYSSSMKTYQTSEYKKSVEITSGRNAHLFDELNKHVESLKQMFSHDNKNLETNISENVEFSSNIDDIDKNRF